MEESKKQFEQVFKRWHPDITGPYLKHVAEYFWEQSRAAMQIHMTPACWITYYPDTDDESFRVHSESGAESCARRIASEIGGYVIPVFHGIKGE